MGQTNIYGFSYLDPYQPTNLDLDMDERRFQAIENQTYTLYSIFGNGIILDPTGLNPSWLIQTSPNNTTDNPIVQISSGTANVGYVAANTLIPTDVPLVLPSGAEYPITYYIYAQKNSTTAATGSVNFITSTTMLNDTAQYVGLGAVNVNAGILTFYNDFDHGRIEISLFASIGNIINKHIHIGGLYNPSPISLAYHVQGKLSGEYIENLDLSTVTQGTLSPDRLPQIDHQSLLRIGTLTHSEINSLLSGLYHSSDSRLSDLTTANLLQLALALKKLPNFANIDQSLFNAILYIPGITSDRYASYYIYSDLNVVSPFVPSNINLATIDTVNNQIVGITGISETSDSINWNTYFDFTQILLQTENATNAERFNAIQSGYLELSTPVNYIGLATDDISSWTQGYVITDASSINATSTPEVFQDTYNIDRYFFNQFTSTQNLSETNRLNIYYNLPLTTSVPGDISLFFLLDSSGTTQNITLSNGTPKSINISSGVIFHNHNDEYPLGVNTSCELNIADFGLSTSQVKNILGVGIHYGSSSFWDKNNIDFELYAPITSDITNPQIIADRGSDTSSIFAWNDGLYYNAGLLIFRFNSGYVSTNYASIGNISSIPTGTKIQIFCRVSNNISDINGATQFKISSTGEIPNNLSGQYIDIIVTFTANSLLNASPALSALTLNFSGPGAAISPKIWDIAEQWKTGTLNDIDIQGNIISNQINSVRVMITANYQIGTGSIPPLIVSQTNSENNITLEISDRILINDPNVQNHNGIYHITSIDTDNGSATLTRSDDASTSAQFIQVFFVTVTDGSYAGKSYYLTTTGITLGPSSINFSEYTNSLKIGTSYINNIGRYIYLRNNQAYYSVNNIETKYETDDSLYLTPVQVFNKITSQGFNGPRSMVTLNNQNVIIADTQNDRVVELDSSGNLVKGIQGNINICQTNMDFVVLMAVYNPSLGTMWIAFSQYVSNTVDKTKISISNGQTAISFASTDPNNSQNIINIVPFNPINSQSATLEVTFPTIFINQINAWQGNINVVIQSGAVTCNGSNSMPPPSTTTTITGISGLPNYIAGPPQTYLIMGKNAMIGQLVALSGYTATNHNLTPATIYGDFNGDGVISNSITSILLGPDGSTNTITVPVTKGNIVFDNLYHPLFVQTTNNGWVVSAVGNNTVTSYSANLDTNWYIPSKVITFLDNIDGNAWELANGYIIAGLPAPLTISDTELPNGNVLIINPNAGTSTNPQYGIVSNIPISNGDAVRVIPTSSETEFWIVVNDRLRNGTNSRIVKIDYSGNTNWLWNGTSSVQIHTPTDIKLLSNNTILISE